MKATRTTTRACQAKEPRLCPRHGIPLHKQYVSETGSAHAFLKAKEAENRVKSSISRVSLKDMNVNELSQELITHAKNSPHMDPTDVAESIELAHILHFHQTRGNRGHFTRTPYIEHPLRNAVRLVRAGCTSQSVIIAAVLHDTVEDGAQQYLTHILGKEPRPELKARAILGQHIQDRFGEKTFRNVEAVTNDYLTDTDRASITPEEKNRIYLEHVRRSIQNDNEVLLVKISDFIDNGTGLHHNDVPGRERQTLKQATKYLPVTDVFIERLEQVRLPIPKAEQERLIMLMRITKIRLGALIKKHSN